MGMFKMDCLALFGSNILNLKEGDIENCLRFSMAFIVKSKMKKQSLFSTLQKFKSNTQEEIKCEFRGSNGEQYK